jgi:hypothetical protein
MDCSVSVMCTATRAAVMRNFRLCRRFVCVGEPITLDVLISYRPSLTSNLCTTYTNLDTHTSSVTHTQAQAQAHTYCAAGASSPCLPSFD